MKKIQVLLTMLAFATAAAGVYAKESVFSTTYYEDTTAPETCNVPISLPCTEGSLVPCKTAAGNNVWKVVDGGTCQQVFKDR
jgi:hypothetical protein